MRTVGERYFHEGVWRSAGPLGLATCTCLVCGHRACSWAAFTAHRRACVGRMTQGPQTPEAPPAEALSEADLDHLAALEDQLHADGAA